MVRGSAAKASKFVFVVFTVGHEEILSDNPDFKDMTSTGAPILNCKASVTIGVPCEYNVAELDDSARWAWSDTLHHCNSLGYDTKSVNLRQSLSAIAAYYVIAPTEAASNLAKYQGVWRFSSDCGKLGDEVVRRILLGTFALSSRCAYKCCKSNLQVALRLIFLRFDGFISAAASFFVKSQQVRRLIVCDLLSALAETDIIIIPTSLASAPTINSANKLSVEESYAGDIFTIPGSLAGFPSLVVPVRTRGMQLITLPGREPDLFKLAERLLDC
jgi:aspartyl-tRNA(Asn)/glutamyl-tRNA(Gln) amidotransferase subunit A